MLPTVVVMFGLCVIVLLALFQYTIAVTNFGSEIIYKQIAQTAARGALDYGKEQFDGDASYTGTPETEMFENNTYKVTFELSVDNTVVTTDSRTKVVKGIGRVYLPKNSATARYSVTLNGEVIRSQIVANNPQDFSPLAWYDASCNASTSPDADCQVDKVLKNGSANAAGNPTGFREEHTAAATSSGCSSPAQDDGSISLTRAVECNSGQQLVGVSFNLNGQLPKGVTITDAYIQMTSAAHDASQIKMNIYGVAQENPSPFSYSGSTTIGSLPRTASFKAWDTGPWPQVNQSGTNQRTSQLKDIVQELINQPGWDPNKGLNFIFEYVSGPGRRLASTQTASMTLNVSYSGDIPAINGDQVSIWKDRSGNGFHMVASSTGKPTLQNSSSNTQPLTSKPMVNFSTSSIMRADLPNNGRKSNAYTAFSVMRVKGGTNTSGDGSLVSMYGSGTGSKRFSPFWRHPTTSHSWDLATGINSDSLCLAEGVTERKSACLSGNIATNPVWSIWASREALTEHDILFRRSGTNFSGQTEYVLSNALVLNTPYTITLGGGKVSGFSLSQPKSDFEVAEIILYDHALSCPQVESIEQYLSDKWGFGTGGLPAFSTYNSGGCIENNIPVY